MALTTIKVNKQTVNRVMPDQWTITWLLTGYDLDGTTKLFEQTFSQDYKKGDSIDRIEQGFIEEMQDYINKYKKEQLILENIQMDTSLSTVQSALEV